MIVHGYIDFEMRAYAPATAAKQPHGTAYSEPLCHSFWEYPGYPLTPQRLSSQGSCFFGSLFDFGKDRSEVGFSDVCNGEVSGYFFVQPFLKNVWPSGSQKWSSIFLSTGMESSW